MTPEPPHDRSLPAVPRDAIPSEASDAQARLASSDLRSYAASGGDEHAYAAQVDAVLLANWASISRQAAVRAAGQAAVRIAAQQVWERRIERLNWLLAAAALFMIVHSSWAALNLRSLVHRSTAALAVVHGSRDAALGESWRFDDVPRAEPTESSRRHNHSSSRSSLDPLSGFSSQPQRA